MDMSMTIEEFDALLAAKEHDSPLLTALRQLMTIEKPEDITALAEDESSDWMNWLTTPP